jgi:hypothetical protein
MQPQLKRKRERFSRMHWAIPFLADQPSLLPSSPRNPGQKLRENLSRRAPLCQNVKYSSDFSPADRFFLQELSANSSLYKHGPVHFREDRSVPFILLYQWSSGSPTIKVAVRRH